MNIQGVYFVLLTFFVKELQTTIDLNVQFGDCQPRIASCMCGGRTGHRVNFKVNQCKYGILLKIRCRDCNEDEAKQRCAIYKNCLECDPTAPLCTSCRANKYGASCESDCKCQNGGLCKINGECVCPEGHEGPYCENESGCLAPPLVKNGRPYQLTGKKSTISKGSSLKYECDEGYVLQGPDTIYCQHDGHWSKDLPVCVPSCPISDHFPNGKVHYESSKQILKYECDHGYGLIGKSLRECGSDASWKGEEPQCVKVTACQDIKPPKNGRVIFHKVSEIGMSPGSEAKFICDSNYFLTGEEKSFCGEDGVWSNPPPECVLEEHTCPLLEDIEHGKAEVEGQREDSFFLKGAKVKFSCDDLYFLAGDSEITCRYNGMWSGFVPTCIKVTTCPEVDNISKGRKHVIVPEPISESRLSLPPSPPNISSRVPLSSPLGHRSLTAPDLRSARLKVKLPKGNYHVGTRISFSCESRYYDLVGSKSRSCQSSGTWSGNQPICIPICGQSSEPLTPLITHGVPSKAGQWPWQVGIARRLADGHPLGEWFIQCGGSIINEEWVVTAAHCFIEHQQLVGVENFRLYFGKYFRNDTQDDHHVQIAHISELHVHPNFEPVSFDSDIALVRVSPAIKFTSHIQPVCLPDVEDDNIKEGDLGVVSGWGKTEDENFSWVLQHTQLPIVDRETCKNEYQKQKINIRVTSNMICAGYEEGKRDTCAGDSGGPYVFPTKGQNTRWVLEGITSWGRGDACGLEKNYSGYVRVRQFMNWIESII